MDMSAAASPSRAGIALSLARMNRIKEINAQRFRGRGSGRASSPRHCRRRWKRRACTIRPTPPAAPIRPSAETSPPTRAGRAALSMASRAIMFLDWRSCWPAGAVVVLGGRTHKNKAGFDLTRLFVGSEGLLGVVTEATLKLIPLPPYRACLAVGFASTREATRALGSIFAAGFLPSALELADCVYAGGRLQTHRQPAPDGVRRAHDR